MVRSLLALRSIMLLAALGAVVGAILMLWQAGSELADAALSIILRKGGKGVTPYVMHATDAILFGIVLIVFAFAITFGFVLDLPPDARQRLPAWMQVEGVSRLKQSLIEVILVYMVVDVATDWAQTEASLEWSSLIKPASIILIAGALRFISSQIEVSSMPTVAGGPLPGVEATRGAGRSPSSTAAG